MKKIILFLITFFPALSFAHVKWFAQEGTPVRNYEVSDTPVLIWVGTTIILVLIGVWLEKKLKTAQWLEAKIPAWHDKVISIASIGFGLAFISFAVSGFIFAPNLPAESYMYNFLILEGLIGFMLVLGVYVRVAGLLIIALYLASSNMFGYIELLDAVELVGVAIFVLIMGRPRWRLVESSRVDAWFTKAKEFAVPILRVGTGVNLMILGFSEKIFAPSLTQNFLSHYQWNFMATFGMSDYWFAFSAGMAEFLIGLLLALGLVTRVTTIALAVFLGTTLYLLGPIELIGHLPHFSIAVVLLVLGSGSKLKLTK